MQIQIKQPEIVEAIKQYISGEGINLKGKTMTVKFVAGRKGSGISADVKVDDGSVPGYDDTAPEAAPADPVATTEVVAVADATNAVTAVPSLFKAE